MQKEKVNGNSNGKEIIRIDLDESESDSTGETTNQQAGNNDNVEPPPDMFLQKLSKTLKELLHGDDMKFMSNFDPESSNREKRKLSRKYNLDGKRYTSLYDEHGVLRAFKRDICDCLDEECLGCHFPCPRCRSYKCGAECRIHRKWMYEFVENEGEKIIIKNNFLTKTPEKNGT